MPYNDIKIFMNDNNIPIESPIIPFIKYPTVVEINIYIILTSW